MNQIEINKSMQKYVQIGSITLKYVEICSIIQMTTRKAPQFIIDLIFGFSKKRLKKSIPISLLQLIALFIWISISQILFSIKFSYYTNNWYDIAGQDGQLVRIEQEEFLESITSISSYMVIPNECYRINLMIGTNTIFQMRIGQNHVTIESQATETSLTKKNGQLWQIDRKSMPFIEIMIKITRDTICDCANTDGNLEVLFRNVKQIHYCALKDSKSIWWWEFRSDFASNAKMVEISKDCRLFGKIKRKETDGYYKMLLPSNFNYNSNENASIEAHGIDKLNLWSTKHANQACDKFGFGYQCCNENIKKQR